MEVLVGILFVNSVLSYIVLFTHIKKVKKLTNMLADISIDIRVYDSVKAQQEKERKAKRQMNKVGHWTK